jgi:[acyl-carrier-protein] S-malonyltransferase
LFMKKYAFVFPGQGSQKVGMGADLLAIPEVQSLFTQASDYLGKDMAALCLDGPADVLTLTENAQPAIFLIAAALWTQIRRLGVAPTIVAGHSLGEITAYYVAGVLSFKEALALIQVRGAAMAAACPDGTAGMAAVMGLGVPEIEAALAPYVSAPVVIANYNCPGQIVVSGRRPVLQDACDALKAAGGKVIPLPVSGAFHSPMMAEAGTALKVHMDTLMCREAAFPIVLNRTATPTVDHDVLQANLPLQVVSSVRWIETVAALASQVDVIVEVGPGKVLQGLVKKTQSDVPVVGVADLAQMQSVFG